MKTPCTKKPELRQFFPVWFNSHGCTMYLQPSSSDRFVWIRGSAASLKITAFGNPANKKWLVYWSVIYSRSERITGTTVMTSEILAAAFGLSRQSDEDAGWLIQRFGADSASQGRYIRWDNFLNIPGPGTGHDGDPNISIEISEPIKDAVRKLLTASQ